MKSPRLSDDLVPVQELRSQLARFIGRVAETGRPVVITQRGRAAAALVSPAMLDELEAERELIRRTLRGLRDLAAGRVGDAGPLLRKPSKARGSKRRRAEPDEEGAVGPAAEGERVAAGGDDDGPGE
jgi:prevent-host-death family protein